MKKIEYDFFSTNKKLKKQAKINLMHSYGRSRVGILLSVYLPNVILAIAIGLLGYSYVLSDYNDVLSSLGFSYEHISLILDKRAWLIPDKTKIVLWIILALAVGFKIIMKYGKLAYFTRLATDIDENLSCFFSGFKHIIKIIYIQISKSIFFILSVATFYLFYLSVKENGFEESWLYLNLILLAVGVILWIISLIRAMKTSMVYRVMIEHEFANKKISVKEIFRTSKELTKTRRMKYVGLNLSFIPLNILSFLTLTIFGLLFAIPYKETTKAFFYLDLK